MKNPTHVEPFAMQFYDVPDGMGGVAGKAIKLPLAIPLVLLLAVTGLSFTRPKLLGSTYCSRCQYDLAGNTSGVCPECGGRV